MILYTTLHKIPFQIDDNDFEAISYYTWCIDVQGYPSTTTGGNVRKKKRLHILLLGYAPKGLMWDHWNRDKLDNRRGNFRAVTATINLRNNGIRVDNKSGVRGVHLEYKKGRAYWTAKVGRIHLGYFKTLEEATEARRKGEIEVWGDNK